MNSIYEEYIYLMRCALKGESADDFDCKNIDALLKIAQMHNMTNMLWYALKGNKSLPQQAAQRLAHSHEIMLFKCANQCMAEQELLRLFGGDGVRHMMLKGACVRTLYPKADMREMTDIDVLTDSTQLERVNELLCAAGYTFGGHKGHHDVYHKEPLVSVEVHETALDHGRETGLDAYFSDPWSLAKANGCLYTLSVSDEYIFLMGHLLGHFRQGGIGIRTVMDMALYIRAHEDELDFEHINSVFSSYGVLEVMKNIAELALYWFGDGQGSELLDEMGEYVFSSGSYGNVENFVKSIADDGSGKMGSALRSIKRKLFISPKELRRRSKIIDKCPILLPIGYIVRLFKILFLRFSELSGWFKGFGASDAQSVKEHKEKLRRFGIN